MCVDGLMRYIRDCEIEDQGRAAMGENAWQDCPAGAWIIPWFGVRTGFLGLLFPVGGR